MIKYRQDIDALRGLSLLLVIFYHAFPKFLSGGFVGVDVFFVISGYLITKIIIKQLDHNKFILKYSRTSEISMIKACSLV